MKAIVCTKYGAPEVLQLKEVEKPVPKENEILIKVYASTVTSGDCRIRSFTFAPWFNIFAGMIFGYGKPKRNIPGDEFAGVVEATGKNVKLFKKGDKVFGISSGLGFGETNAEYKCLAEDKMIALHPSNISFEETAALSFGGLSALYFLRKANIRKGQKVLIYGASGGVGTFSVQIAKFFGAEVTGVCSTTNIELVRSIGADHVIDYTKEDFIENGQIYDVIFDAVIKTSFSHCKSSLKKRGIYLTVDWPLIQALLASIRGGKKLIFGTPPNKTEDLIFLKELLEEGKIRTVIDKRYSLDQVSEAHAYVDKGHKKGNVIIKVVNDEK